MQATFTQGSILRHICVMTFSSAAGLLMLFFVDLLDMFWLSLLGETELAAALGYAGSVLFFTLSAGIGLSIGCGTTVSHSVGGGNREKTRALVGAVLAITCLTSAVIASAILLTIDPILLQLGAHDQSFIYAHNYLAIVLPTMPLMTFAMASAAIMRAFGHAKQSMYITMLGGVVNGVLDPVFIFAVGWGVEGAAVATALSRLAMLLYSLRLLTRVHNYGVFPSLPCLRGEVSPFFKVALPAMLTNLSTPISFAYITYVMASFGDSAVAGNTVIMKIQPLVFVGLFALSGAIGPIVGQNYGAKRADRILDVLKQSALFIGLYCLLACSALFALTRYIIVIFQMQGDAADLVHAFCVGLSTVFIFNGLTFCTNAMFNNLNVAHWATLVNFVRATVFTIPFAYLGAELGGAVGTWVGIYIGAVLVAALGVGLAYYKIQSIQRRWAC